MNISNNNNNNDDHISWYNILLTQYLISLTIQSKNVDLLTHLFIVLYVLLI